MAPDVYAPPTSAGRPATAVDAALLMAALLAPIAMALLAW